LSMKHEQLTQLL